MIRSGLLGIVVLITSSLAIVGVLALVVFRFWMPAAALAGVGVAAMVVAMILLRHADPEQMKARAATNEKWMDGWARAMANASGAWEPRRSKPHRRRN